MYGILMATSMEVGKEIWYATSGMATLMLMLVVMLILLLLFSLVFKWMRSIIHKDDKYNLLEVGALRKTAKSLI